MSDSFIKMKLHIISREDACICTYTLNFERFDLILNKWEGGGEGDSELGSSSDAAVHLLRPVLGTFRLCSSGLMYHITSNVYWTHISGLTFPPSTQLVSITIVCSWCSHTILQNCSNDSGSGPSGEGKARRQRRRYRYTYCIIGYVFKLSVVDSP